MKKTTFVFVAIVLAIGILVSCSKFEPQLPIADQAIDAPLDGLTPSQNKLHLDGAAEFDEVYTSANGLGPVYVATSCGGCHSGVNKGHPSTILTRFGQTDTTGNNFLDKGGPQLQNHALQGHLPEILPNGVAFSKFIAPITSGLGFLELVSDADIIAMSKANNNNTDGVRGRPNWNTVPNYVAVKPNAISQNGKYICRFGRKASTYDLHQQTVQAFNHDMGVTSTYLPQNPINYLEGLTSIPTNDPEISDKNINAVVFYTQTLQTPIQRNIDNPNVLQGKQNFVTVGCESCHKESLKTGYSPIEALSNKVFHPYTDLLLHDMGANLDDLYTEGTAKTSEWRTTPLWGLGLAQNAQGGNVYLLHDGRAKSIEEAILLHGGESEKSKIRYQNLSQTEKNNLIEFLKSL